MLSLYLHSLYFLFIHKTALQNQTGSTCSSIVASQKKPDLSRRSLFFRRRRNNSRWDACGTINLSRRSLFFETKPDQSTRPLANGVGQVNQSINQSIFFLLLTFSVATNYNYIYIDTAGLI
jgi:hypothetical protein